MNRKHLKVVLMLQVSTQIAFVVAVRSANDSKLEDMVAEPHALLQDLLIWMVYASKDQNTIATCFS
jgi:hypothetical protein